MILTTIGKKLMTPEILANIIASSKRIKKDKINNIKAMEAKINKHSIKTMQNFEKRYKCCGNHIPIYTWMFIRWYGTPWPKRIWQRWRNNESTKINNEIGCGCPVKVKATVYAITSCILYIWRA